MIWVWGDTVDHEPSTEGTADMSPQFGGRGTRGLLYGYPVGAIPGGPKFRMILENVICEYRDGIQGEPQSVPVTFWRLYRVETGKLQHIENFGLLEDALQFAEIRKMNEESMEQMNPFSESEF
jgi:hypothetical protein